MRCGSHHIPSSLNVQKKNVQSRTYHTENGPKVQVDNSITSPGSAADRGTNDKERAWLELVEAQGNSFTALCHEFHGLIGDGGLGMLDKAAAR